MSNFIYLTRKPKFYGILSKTNYTNYTILDNIFLQELIKHEIIKILPIYQEVKKNNFSKDDSYNVNSSPSSLRNSKHFTPFINFNEIIYSINDIIYEEIFNLFKLAIEKIYCTEIKNEKLKEQIYIESILCKNNKIEYIKKRKFNLLNEEVTDINYLKYIGIYKSEHDVYENWFDVFKKLLIQENEENNFIFNFLKGNEISIQKMELYSLWQKFYRVKYLSKFYSDEYEKISTHLISNETNPNLTISNSKELSESEKLEMLIFKGNGLNIFNLIIKKYSITKQNNAFFSFLYFYLKEKDCLISKKNDSIRYREYILLISELNSYSKIISNNNGDTKEIRFKNFDDILKNYSDELNKN